MPRSKIIDAALHAATLSDALCVQALIEKAVGGRHERPLGDTWKNLGVFSWTGSVDLKVTEPVTNMQDALIEKLAVAKFGSREAVPYTTPRQAADDLLEGMSYQSVGDMVTVSFVESDPPATATKRLTAIFRDQGVGLAPEEIPSTIFGVGSSGKDDCPWLQGAFGMGGKSVYRYAQSVIVVTRKDPALLAPGEADRVCVAVVERTEHAKTDSLYYLVDRPWNGAGHPANPYSVPAAEYPEFEPGTHLALISLQVEGFHRQRLGDERSFDTVLDTRLFEPVTPVRFRNEIVRERNTYLRGLERRLDENRRDEWRHGDDTLPFVVDGQTYRLPVKFWVFAPPGDPGARRKYVAAEHSLMYTSNGQSHKHWSSQDFRHKTELNKLADRVLVVVETDDLPIRVRTNLFSPDRSDSMFSETESRLESAVVGFLNAWEELREIQNDLIREAIMGDGSNRSTAQIAARIARVLSLRGFGASTGTGGGGNGPHPHRPPRAPQELYADPTHLEGPSAVIAKTGTTKFLHYSLNATDAFGSRASLTVRCTHPAIGDRELAVGPLHNGLVRVSVAVPDSAELGVFELDFVVDDWLRSAGGAGPRMNWQTAVEVVDELPTPSRGGTGTGGGRGHSGAQAGHVPPVIWTTAGAVPGWDARTVGEIQKVPAAEIASGHPDEYGNLEELGSEPIDVLLLSEDFGPLKDYRSLRLARVGEDAVRMSEERYAIGVGVGLFMFESERRRRIDASLPVDEELMTSAAGFLARSVLSVLPDFDRLAQEAGLEQG